MSVGSLRSAVRVMDSLSPEQAQVLDQWSGQLQGALKTLVDQGGPAAQRVKNWLNGVWLGHALHPALTDVPIGAWSTGFVLDLVGERRPADAALTVGVIAAVPTALAGAADWADTADEQRRGGLIHAVLNSIGLVCMIGSLFARRAEQRAVGFGLSTAGLALATFSAWLGGELVYRLGTAVNRNAWLPTLDEFVPAIEVDKLEPGKLTGATVEIEGQPVSLVLLKEGDSVLALSGTCSHWGGPLAEGKLLEDECVECPWHASQFSMRDGSVLQGPATTRQPVFETRMRNGMLEVRRRAEQGSA
ncbi:MAG: Rieske 2Fe-2S domain-containing protein [Chloroflexota bacterium]|nr:Rieske 2Fe-2S domain-containing protein [Chloroflexota bacterium]